MTRKLSRLILPCLLGSCALFGPQAGAITTIDIADSGATDVLFTGATAYVAGHLGASMASGDFNGDDLTDLAIGAPGMNSPQGIVRAGNVYLYFGSTGMNGLPAEVTTQDGLYGAMLYGELDKERAGDLLARGDFNGDGSDDLVIVGQNGVDNAGSVEVTRIWVLYGRPGLAGTLALATTADVLIQRASRVSTSWPSFQVGAIAGGDLNGDGMDDLILSDKVNNEFRVLLGKAQKWPAAIDLETGTDVALWHSQDTNLYSTNYFPLYGQEEIPGVAAGDLNGDGIDDLAVGVPNETVGGLTNAGRVYVVYGGAGFVNGAEIAVDQQANVVLTGGCLKDKAGGPLAIGRLNGDGVGDLVIGQPRSQRCTTNSTDLGRVQVVFGGGLPAAVNLFTDADATFNLSGDGSPGSVGRIGFKTGQVVQVADLNDDRNGDLLISSPGAFHTNGANGWVHVVYGGPALGGNYLLDQDADLWFETPEPVGPRLVAGRMGESLAVGDFNDDGLPDLALGAPLGMAEDGGFVPLIFDPGIPEASSACSGVNGVVSGSFAGGTFLCTGSVSLASSGTTAVEAGARLYLRAPKVQLKSPFHAKRGGLLSARP
jgi:hypothetical protein